MDFIVGGEHRDDGAERGEGGGAAGHEGELLEVLHRQGQEAAQGEHMHKYLMTLNMNHEGHCTVEKIISMSMSHTQTYVQPNGIYQNLYTLSHIFRPKCAILSE